MGFKKENEEKKPIWRLASILSKTYAWYPINW